MDLYTERAEREGVTRQEAKLRYYRERYGMTSPPASPEPESGDPDTSGGTDERA